jgi:cbb3-type cytochrome oxidase subunit 3
MPPTELPLKDLHLPDPINWFPPAIGWWLVIVLIPVIIALSYWLYRRLTRKTALKSAKILLITIKNNRMDNAQKLAELSALLRRVAISVAPRAQTAGLTGQAWLAFLDSSLIGSPFTKGAGQCLASAPYRPSAPSELEISQLISLCEDWLKAQKLS